jgi:hypothetical protein
MGTDRGTGGPEQPQEWFPTIATVPGPQTATGSAVGAPSERCSRGRERRREEREEPKWGGRD